MRLVAASIKEQINQSNDEKKIKQNNLRHLNRTTRKTKAAGAFCVVLNFEDVNVILIKFAAVKFGLMRCLKSKPSTISDQVCRIHK
jgi:hypothetical protein